ncbi:MAG: mediator of RNA polymerase II transcription subunit 22 [Lasallia pustulata]|uniref:Mediator of RNA polymerase II transcription subunit 22 n=1 Tax=Lasallia pustulata TaxID=136370 RepID=A0A5M8PYW7_9LECA|nr:MAG: mediator of RNA polymerase II transcription subunit 22 [Lasallia pustulata]
MDASQRSSGALLDRAGADVAQLLRQFENIIALAPVEGAHRNTTAVEAYQMEVATAALVRAAEDMLALTRSLKEAWLFGKLDTVGESKAEARTEECAKGVVKGLERLMEGKERLGRGA